MRLLSFALLAVWMVATFAGERHVLDIEVQGMSCPFCVYGVEKSLKQITGVEDAEVDLKAGLARVRMQPDAEPNPERFREAILDAGFTPGKITTAAEHGE